MLILLNKILYILNFIFSQNELFIYMICFHFQISVSHNLEEILVGTTQVTFTAIDPSGNTNSCTLNFTIIGKDHCIINILDCTDLFKPFQL